MKRRIFNIGDIVYIIRGSVKDNDRHKLVEGKVSFANKSITGSSYDVLFIEEGIEKIETFGWKVLYLKSDIEKLRALKN